MFLIPLLLLFFQTTNQITVARTKAISYLKALSFNIPQAKIPLSQRKELISSWFVNYNPRPREDLQDPENGSNRFDPFISLFTVTIDGIFFKRIEETWRKLDPLNYINSDLEILYESEIENLITAAHAAGNDSILIIGKQDLKITTFDLRNGKLEKVLEIDTKIGDDEGDFLINSIWKIPYSNFAITSSNRYEILKFNFLKGEKKRLKNFLGPIRHIVGPVETDNPEREPYNDKNDFSGYPQHLRELEKKTFFIATGDTKPMNFIGDWTTAEPLHFFSLETYSNLAKEDKKVDYIVQSIAFIGVNPKSHTYAMTTQNSKLLYIYNAMMMKLDYYKENQYDVKNLRWINGTRFLAQQTEKDYYYLIHTDEYEHVEILTGVASMKKLYGVSFEMELGGEQEDLDQDWEWLTKKDRLFLSLENVQNKLNIFPPYYSFEECDFSMSPALASGVYGRYRHCQKCNVHLEDYSPIDPEVNLSEAHENQTYVNCQKHHCAEGEVFYSYVSYNLKTRESQYNQDMIPSGGKIGCEAKHELKEEEKPFSVDDGCRPGFKMNLYGACQECSEQGCNDCYNYIGLTDNCMTNNIYQYSFEKIDTEIFYKGYELFHENSNYWEVAKEGSLLVKYRKKYFYDAMNAIDKNFYKTSYEQFWIYQTKRTRDCYTRNYYGGDNYILGVKKGFTLVKAENVNFSISLQKEKDNVEDPLNKFVCVKECPEGFYYDYDSLSCRRCSFRCARCTSFERCDVCEAGMNLNHISKYFLEKLNIGVWGDLLENYCYPGCIEGSFMKTFNGNCYLCGENCEKCEDSFIKGNYRKYNLNKEDSGFCIECSGDEVILDLLYGNCTKNCEGQGREIKVVEGKKNCDFCLAEKCKICSENDKAKCYECEDGFFLREGGCVKAQNILLWVILIVGFLLILGGVLATLFICKVKKKTKEENLKLQCRMEVNFFFNFY